jgi:spore germination cell wall hydrolase CwlJ-like protein
MVALRKQPRGTGYYGPFGIAVLIMCLMPRQIGYQDMVAFMARQPEAWQRARAHMLASPFGTIHAATFSFPQPVGSLIPEPPMSLPFGIEIGDRDVTGSVGGDGTGRGIVFLIVNRRLKGDLLITRPREEQPPADGTRDLTPGRVKTVSFPRPASSGQAQGNETSPLTEIVDGEKDSADRLAKLYFSKAPSGEAVGTIQPWPSDEKLVIQASPGNDPDIKNSALAPTDDNTKISATAAGVSVASKGEVTGPDRRPKTPAERLGLNKTQRAKAEKCLADAVYFESRGESKRGQIAVAQVVMNRVFSGFYPTDVCGVVYQNAHRKFACQFTFACDNVPEVVDEPDMWAQATDIARDILDGKLWLPEIGHSTHYHAFWVHPSWVGEMRRMFKIGVHKFYRPRAWGDGSEVPPLNQSQSVPQAKADDAANKAKL